MERYKKLNILLGSIFLLILLLFFSSPHCSNFEKKGVEQKQKASFVVVGKYTVSYDRSVYPNHPPTFNPVVDLADILNTNGVQWVEWTEHDLATGKDYFCEKMNVGDLGFRRVEIKFKKN